MRDRGSDLRPWRKARMREVERKAEDLRGEQERWAQELHPDVRRVGGHLHGPLLGGFYRKSDMRTLSTLNPCRQAGG